MTDSTQPEALDLADWLEAVGGGSSTKRCAALLREQHARIADLEAQLEAIGAGGVTGPLVGQPQAMPDLSQLTERGAVAWAGVDAQALREGRWYMVTNDGVATLCEDRRDAEKEAKDADMAWPHSGPHRAVQLAEASTAGFTAADMATAAAQGFRDGVASLAASAGEPQDLRPALATTFHGLSDRAYCNYIEQMRRDVCLGWEYKTKHGKFGEAELKGHTKAGELLGRHKAFAEAANALEGSAAPLAAPPTAQAEGVIAEQALRKVLAAVQRYMPPDGPDAKDTLSEIIAIVDPWPLGPLEKS